MAEQPYARVYAVVRGQASESGDFGHLGAYDRELAVVEVVEIRAFRQGDCD